MSINTITTLGERETLRRFINLTISGDYYDDGITRIGGETASASGQPFRNQVHLTSIDLPNLEYINNYYAFWFTDINSGGAFSNCTNLKSVNFPKLAQIERNCLFANCPSLEHINMPLIDKVVPDMFYGCDNLVLDQNWLRNIKTINTGAFRNFKPLINADLVSAVSEVGSAYTIGRLFCDCVNLRRVYLPGLPNFYSTEANLNNCTSLEIFRTPIISGFGPQYFRVNRTSINMKLADLGNAPTIGAENINNMVVYCKILIMRKSDAITTIANATAFSATTTPTPIKVYVPSALKADYEAGTNWSTLLANGYVEFRNLEGSRFEDPEFDDTDIYNADRDDLDELL